MNFNRWWYFRTRTADHQDRLMVEENTERTGCGLEIVSGPVGVVFESAFRESILLSKLENKVNISRVSGYVLSTFARGYTYVNILSPVIRKTLSNKCPST